LFAAETGTEGTTEAQRAQSGKGKEKGANPLLQREEERNRESDAAFRKAVTDHVAGRRAVDLPLRVGATPTVWQAVGAPDLPVVLDPSVINKARDKHGLAVADLEVLPQQLRDPVAVFRAKDGGGLIVLTEWMRNGKPVIAAVHLAQRVYRYEVNDIASVHGRNLGDLKEWLDNRRLLYVNTQKSQTWQASSGLSVPEVNLPPSGSNQPVLTEADVVKQFGGLLQRREEAGDATGRQAVAAATPRRTVRTLEDARTAALKEIVDQPLTNEATKFPATVSRNSVGKMTSESPVRKSVSPEVHALAVANVDQLYRAAELLGVETDRAGDINIRGIHRFGAALIADGEVYGVKLTVKELATGNRGNRLYSVEALDVEKAKPTGNRVGDASEDAERATPQVGFEKELAEIVGRVKRALQKRESNETAQFQRGEEAGGGELTAAEREARRELLAFDQVGGQSRQGETEHGPGGAVFGIHGAQPGGGSRRRRSGAGGGGDRQTAETRAGVVHGNGCAGAGRTGPVGGAASGRTDQGDRGVGQRPGRDGAGRQRPAPGLFVPDRRATATTRAAAVRGRGAGRAVVGGQQPDRPRGAADGDILVADQASKCPVAVGTDGGGEETGVARS